MADSASKPTLSYSSDPTLYLYTSLTAGSSHIISATSRLETILKANRVPFRAIDVATDEKARMLWGRRAGKRKLPGLVKEGMVVGDLEQIEEWNEYGELKENLGPLPPVSTPSASGTPAQSATPKPFASQTQTAPAPAPKPAASSQPQPQISQQSQMTLTMRQAGEEAAKKASEAKAASIKKPTPGVTADKIRPLDSSTAATAPPTGASTDLPPDVLDTPLAAETISSSATTKSESIEAAIKAAAAAAAAAPSSAGASGGGLSGMTPPGPTPTLAPSADPSSSSSPPPAPQPGAVPVPHPRSSSSSGSLPRRSSWTNVPPPSSPPMEGHPRTHRGSSLSVASMEEIQQAERAWMIPEDPNESAITVVEDEGGAKAKHVEHSPSVSNEAGAGAGPGPSASSSSAGGERVRVKESGGESAV
ncbi:hypothetical protein L228DRAFT_260462 [Xylona heveae TC161]|uniref:Uncharacterized protein n=1 Tax=Xylona heveae (strain CBS 132557 / TC161) TaxID=1328760 RepID=A0A165HL67_XYLHT|nr:hypothetical protein L228DRAFT_260462 [Xylona heveae TC161]KZF23681.1 hypothetical protein L228DRAFT_260462 [Xylona heveae TC161]